MQGIENPYQEGARISIAAAVCDQGFSDVKTGSLVEEPEAGTDPLAFQGADHVQVKPPQHDKQEHQEYTLCQQI